MKNTWVAVCVILLITRAGDVNADSKYDEINKEIRPHDYLVVPEGQGPFPVAIILHRSDGPQKMDRVWARLLADNGIAGLVVKSYSTFIGYDTKSESFSRLKEMTPERVQHILATIDYLHSQSWADPSRIALLGRSHGAWAALWFLATEMTPEDNKGVKAIVAYYPDCEFDEPYTRGWSANIPVLIQMGNEDPAVSNTPCIKMAESQRAEGRTVIYEVYKNKGHDVDMGNDDIAQQARIHTLKFLMALLHK